MDAIEGSYTSLFYLFTTVHSQNTTRYIHKSERLYICMTEKLKILVLIKPFWMYAKHKPKFEMIQSLEKYADVYYWYQDGHIKDILKRLKIRPHFIFHYDIAWNYGLAPKI